MSPLAGTELEIARQVVANATHQVTVRFNDFVTARKRFVFENRELNIENVRNIDERGIEMVCLCVEQT